MKLELNEALIDKVDKMFLCGYKTRSEFLKSHNEFVRGQIETFINKNFSKDEIENWGVGLMEYLKGKNADSTNT
jgi:metal-responsive CopG/Arc/MetJ family transcriptional regulator